MSHHFHLALLVFFASWIYFSTGSVSAAVTVCASSSEGAPHRPSSSPHVSRVYAFKNLLSDIREGTLSPEELARRFPAQSMTYQTNQGKPRVIEGMVFGAVKDREGHIELSFAPTDKGTVGIRLEDLDLVSVTIPVERTHTETSELSQFIERVARRELPVTFVATSGQRYAGLILPEAPPGEFFPGAFFLINSQGNRKGFRVEDVAGEVKLEKPRTPTDATVENTFLVPPVHKIPEGAGQVQIVKSVQYTRVTPPPEAFLTEDSRRESVRGFLFLRSPNRLEANEKKFLLGLPEMELGQLLTNPSDLISGHDTLRYILKSDNLDAAIRLSLKGAGRSGETFLTRSTLSENVSTSFWQNYIWPTHSPAELSRTQLAKSKNIIFELQNFLREAAADFAVGIVEKYAPDVVDSWKKALPEDLQDPAAASLLLLHLGLKYSLSEGMESAPLPQLTAHDGQALAGVIYLVANSLQLTSKNEAAPRISAQARPLATNHPGANWVMPEGTFFERLLSAFEDGGYRYENGVWRK